MDSFSVGDVCEVVSYRGEGARKWLGKEVVITSIGKYFGLDCEIRDSDGGLGYCSFAVLRKKKPPYDGNQITKWDDCPFKPKEMVRV